MRINTNVQAINAYRQLTISYGNVSKNIERLSSGLRINRAGDDAAGLAISEKMRSQIRGLNMAERNTLDGISLIQTAEGALQEVHNALQRMRELAIQSANGTLASDDRIAIQNEIDQLTFDIDRIAKTTQFNANPLLRGSLLSRPVITTNSADIKYIGGGTWGGDLVAEPSERGEVELEFKASPTGGEYVVINGKTYEFTTGTAAAAGRIKVQIGDDDSKTLTNLMESIRGNDNLFDASASIVSGSSLFLKTVKNMSPEEAQKISVGVSDPNQAEFKKSVANAPSMGKIRVEIQFNGAIHGGYSINLNNETYEFVTDMSVVTDNIKVLKGNDRKECIDNLVEAIKANDDIYEYDTDVDNILTLTTVEDVTDDVFNNFAVSSSVPSINIPPIEFEKAEIESLNASYTSTNLKTIYLNVTEPPKTGDRIQIGDETTGITIRFGDNTIPYFGGEATINVKNKNIYDIMDEIFSVITSAKNDNKAKALTDFKINGNSLILTTDKTDDGADNSLQIQYVDNDFETHAGKDMQINLQIGANDSESMTLLIGVIDSAFLGIARKADYKEIISTAGIDAEAGVSVLTEEDANNAITFFDNAIRLVSESRSRLGAYQNRLEHTLANVTTAAENLTAAESRIRDVDMALEMSEYTKNNIINQAATAMLAQANMIPQGVLQLLQ